CLDLHDLGAAPGQRLGAGRSRLELGEVEDLDAPECRCWRFGCDLLLPYLILHGDPSVGGRGLKDAAFVMSLHQLCQANCCALRVDPCDSTTLASAGPLEAFASSSALRMSFGSLTNRPLPPKASITLS